MRIVCVAFAIGVVTQPVKAQSPQDTAISIARLDAQIAAHEDLLEREVWPGYRYTKLGLMYVIPGRAKIATHWPGRHPGGMQPLPGFTNAVWTDTAVVSWQSGLPVASLAISPTQSRGEVAGLALHEAFHGFEIAERRKDRRFGRGENSMLTSQYPVFDIQNEAAIAVEARLLKQAVEAKSLATARLHAQQFVAVRKQRQARLDSSFVDFEKLSEMHEGLAQYVLLRGLDVLSKQIPEFRNAAIAEKQGEADLLANTLARTNLSVRRRAYALGSYQGLLLDRLAPTTWKQRVMERDEFLQDIIADVAGPARTSASTTAMLNAAVSGAAMSVGKLREERITQRNELLAKEATTLIVDPSALGRFEWCGFDPQNLITTGSGQLLHTRMVRLCREGKPIGQIYQSAVEEQLSGRVLTPVNVATVKVTVNGSAAQLPSVGESITVENLKIATDNVEIETRRGILVRGNKALVIIPLM